MRYAAVFETILTLTCLALQVHGHGALVAITGANGVDATGFGIDTSTPRDGSKRNPFEQDTSIINDKDIARGKAGVCGRTLESGSNDVAASMAAASAAGLPSADTDGTVTMTLHQVNGDGAGPYTCEVSTDGTGNSFTPMTVTTNVPGTNSRSNAKATDFPLVAKLPAGTKCTGGPNGDACLVRCRNSARAGPFGGCAAITTADSASSNTTSTADSSTSTTEDLATSTTEDSTSTTSAEKGSKTESADSATATDVSGEADSEDTTSEPATASADATPTPTASTKGKKKKVGRAPTPSHQLRMLNSRVVGKARSGSWM